MEIKYLDFICTKDSFIGGFDESVVCFDAYNDYERLVEFYDACPECESFPKEEYFSGDWYDKWEDYVIRRDGRIAARAAIWKCDAEQWEVAGVITRPEYRGQGLSTGLVSHCIADILGRGKRAHLTTAENNYPMIRVAEKVGFVPRG